MNPKPPHSEYMLHLDPSADIPFMHDGLGAHDAKLDELNSAVVDSGAMYVRDRSPWYEENEESMRDIYGHFDDEEFKDEAEHDYKDIPPPPLPPTFAHGIGSAAMKIDKVVSHEEQKAIDNWIQANIRYDYDQDSGDYRWNVHDEDQAFLQAHRQQIMESIPHDLRYSASLQDIVKVIKIIAQGNPFGNEFASRMIKENPYILTDNPELFPDFVFDMDYVRAMVRENGHRALMSKWRCINEDCLQEAVDLVLEQNPAAVYGSVGELVEKVHISRELLIGMAGSDPYKLLDMIQQGHFPEVKQDMEIIEEFRGVIATSNLIEAGIFDELTIVAINRLMSNRSYKARMFYRLQQMGRINTFDEAIEAIDIFGAEAIAGEVSGLSQEVQSYVFQSMATGSSTEWIGYLGQFSSLSDDDYIFILDSMQLIDEKLQSIDLISDLFINASDQLKAEFESVYAPIRERRLREKRQQKEMNERRKHQAEAERTYFDAGSVSVEPHDYHEPLDADGIIDALERNGCVRMAGDIQEIANDPSRGNLMTCVAGSFEQLSTNELGAGANANMRKTVTEYEALQEFMDFIRNFPETPDGHKNSLETELTYIGEREYSEAVEGIALYWKWFLEKDPNSQLYIGAVVSDEGTTKSDIYMLDRILKHFSDDEMTKYKGRILTGKDQVTQSDPEKVKVVLIDDWTISGSQLRVAYSNFVQEYPHLAKSIEIQLIAASRERVALGIEDVSGRHYQEGVHEKSVPTKVRAYFVAHVADSAVIEARRARITGSHSSVDYGFTSDIARSKEWGTIMPMIAAVVRPYRQKDYKKTNIERLNRINEGLSNAA